jgi:hypothetical protein
MMSREAESLHLLEELKNQQHINKKVDFTLSLRLNHSQLSSEVAELSSVRDKLKDELEKLEDKSHNYM